MFTQKRGSVVAALGLIVFAPLTAVAATSTGNYSVEQIVIDQVNFSGCMARVIPNPKTDLPECGGSFVTFDCKGILGTSKSDSAAALSAAQLALVARTEVFMRVDDTKRANGYCLAVRIDNTNTPVTP